MRVIRLISRFARCSRTERSILMRALFVGAVARAALWVFPLESARFVTDLASRGTVWQPVERLIWGATVAGRYLPLTTCLTQAVAAQAVLARAGHESQVEIGVAIYPYFRAHAWLVHAGEIVLGADEASRYCPIIALE